MEDVEISGFFVFHLVSVFCLSATRWIGCVSFLFIAAVYIAEAAVVLTLERWFLENDASKDLGMRDARVKDLLCFEMNRGVTTWRYYCSYS